VTPVEQHITCLYYFFCPPGTPGGPLERAPITPPLPFTYSILLVYRETAVNPWKGPLLPP